jgi:hypothetical protein
MNTSPLRVRVEGVCLSVLSEGKGVAPMREDPPMITSAAYRQGCIEIKEFLARINGQKGGRAS